MTSPPPQSGGQQSANNELSPEQISRIEQKRAEAEAKLLTKRLGAGAIGDSWMQAMQSEFKKSYIDNVCIPSAQHVLSTMDSLPSI